MGLNDDLRELENQGTPIQMGLVGAGQMGRGLISQVELMRGMRVVAVADLLVDRVVEAYRLAGVPDDNIVVVEDMTAANEAVAAGKRVATTKASLLPAIEGVEAIVDASGVPEVGATVAFNTILHRKHAVMLTVETDVTVGYMLRSMAEAAGVVYTVSAGDEPGAIKELYDFADALGFEIVAAGKGKNNPLNRKATPDTLAAEAAAKEMNAKMLASFVDGTKTMVEMTAVANATGLVPEVRGMHGPTTTVADLPNVFSLREQGGILQRSGVVDYALGVAPGVFVIVTTHQEEIVKELRYLKVGSGPNWVLFRPYHLTSIETPLSVGKAVLYEETTIATTQPPVAETFAVAKRRLHTGEVLDTIGGFTFYGLIERADVSREERLLPVGLAPGAVLTHDVDEGQPITYDDVQLDESKTILNLRRMQDKLT